MSRVALLLTLLTLAACGADGPPVRPTLNAGVSLGPGGVATAASVGVKAGNVAIHIGL